MALCGCTTTLDLVVGHGEQVVRLDDLEALVHERRRVDGDLRAHVPRGMSERLSRRDSAQFISRTTAEGAAGRGHPQTAHLARALANEALVDSAVLRVDGHERSGGPVSGREAGGATLLVHPRGKRHDEVAPYHERFLVRQREHLARAQRLVAGAQAGGAHQGVHHHVRLFQAAQLRDGIRAETEGGVGCAAGRHARVARVFAMRAFVERVRRGSAVRQPRPRREACPASVIRQARIAHGDMAHAECPRLPQHLVHASVHGQADHSQLVRMAPHDVERLHADGPCRAQNHDVPHTRPPCRDAPMIGHAAMRRRTGRQARTRTARSRNQRAKWRSWRRRGTRSRTDRASRHDQA